MTLTQLEAYRGTYQTTDTETARVLTRANAWAAGGLNPEAVFERSIAREGYMQGHAERSAEVATLREALEEMLKLTDNESIDGIPCTNARKALAEIAP